MSRPETLSVFYGDEQVGAIRDASPMVFEYAQSWLMRPEPKQLAAIALQPGPITSEVVQAFFENLLPEGELRVYIAAQRKASTLFSMLMEVAGDTAGGFVVLPEGQVPEPADFSESYEPTTWEAIAAVLKRKSAAAIDIKGGDARISLAGAQDKATIAIFADGVPQLPRGTAPSNHILKPNIRRLAKVRESAVNEAIIMLAAAKCGLPTAEVFYEPHTQSCVVRRFDRITRADGGLGRLIQYDLCQLAGIGSERKYEKEGGPGIAQCADLIRRYSTQPAVDLRNFVNWIFFNLFTGNNDSHAKNLSIYELPGKGLMLTPFYDLMCTGIYPGLSKEFAFQIGGEVLPGQMGSEQFALMAKTLNMRVVFLRDAASALAKRLPAAMASAHDEVLPKLTPAGAVFAQKLVLWVGSTTKKAVARFSGQPDGAAPAPKA
jgi:serine/threonine-protein kinase HipA